MKKTLPFFLTLFISVTLTARQNTIRYKTGPNQPNYQVRSPMTPMFLDDRRGKYVLYVNVNRSTGDLFVIRFTKDFSKMEIDYWFEILDTKYMYDGSGYRSSGAFTIHSRARSRFIVSFRIPMEDTLNNGSMVMRGKLTTWIK